MADRKVGDIEKSEGGIITTVTAIDPETNSVSWDVAYSADYQRLFNEITDLMDTAKEVADITGEPFFRDHYLDIRKRRNELRTYLRNNKSKEYARIKGLDEMSSTGGTASFTPGKGAQYATPNAFNPNKKAKGTAHNYYYKLGFKPVPKPHSTKGVEVKYLWGKK